MGASDDTQSQAAGNRAGGVPYAQCGADRFAGKNPLRCWAQVSLRTCFQHQEVQGIIPQVGGGSDLMGGDPQDELLIVSPGEKEAAGRQAQDAVLLRGCLEGQFLQLLQMGKGTWSEAERRQPSGRCWGSALREPTLLQSQLSSSGQGRSIENSF